MVRTGMIRCWYIWCCYVVGVLWWVLVLWGACLLGYLYGGVRIYGGMMGCLHVGVGMVGCWL